MSIDANFVILIAIVGGNWNNGANDGFFYWNLNNDSSNSNTNIGARNHLHILKIYCSLLKLYNFAHYSPCPLAKIEHKQEELVVMKVMKNLMRKRRNEKIR